MNVRAPGSIGQSAYPSRVIKGVRMSGHMGDERVTVKGLTVAKVDTENNLLMVRGAVPGANGSVVIIKKAARQKNK
jgi:large subunit ribosomal protein L3